MYPHTYGLAVLLSLPAISIADEPPQADNLAQVVDTLKQSDHVSSAPVYYHLGIKLRNEGRYEDAAGYFLAAAQGGYRLAEVELAYLHAEESSVLRDDPAAFAWFTLALTHERNLKLAKILKSNQRRVQARMSAVDRAEARRLSKVLLNNLGSIPAHNEPK